MPAANLKPLKAVALCRGLSLSIVQYNGRKRVNNLQPKGTQYFGFEKLPSRYLVADEVEDFSRQLVEYMKSNGRMQDFVTEADAPRLLDFLRGIA